MTVKKKFGGRAVEVLYTAVPHGEALLQMHRNEKQRKLEWHLQQRLLELEQKMEDTRNELRILQDTSR